MFLQPFNGIRLGFRSDCGRESCYLRQQRRDDEQDQPQQRTSGNGNNSNGRKTIGFNKGFKKF